MKMEDEGRHNMGETKKPKEQTNKLTINFV
jgi:hypothetical protein